METGYLKTNRRGNIWLSVLGPTASSSVRRVWIRLHQRFLKESSNAYARRIETSLGTARGWMLPVRVVKEATPF